MYKIFHVKKGTNVEKAVNQLVNHGCHYIPTFEKELGIVTSSLDLEVVSNAFDNSRKYLIVDGFSDCTNYHNDDLLELTVGQFRSHIKKGYSVRGTGSSLLLKSVGYMLIKFNKTLNIIERAS